LRWFSTPVKSFGCVSRQRGQSERERLNDGKRGKDMVRQKGSFFLHTGKGNGIRI